MEDFKTLNFQLCRPQLTAECPDNHHHRQMAMLTFQQEVIIKHANKSHIVREQSRIVKEKNKRLQDKDYERQQNFFFKLGSIAVGVVVALAFLNKQSRSNQTSQSVMSEMSSYDVASNALLAILIFTLMVAIKRVIENQIRDHQAEGYIEQISDTQFKKQKKEVTEFHVEKLKNSQQYKQFLNEKMQRASKSREEVKIPEMKEEDFENEIYMDNIMVSIDEQLKKIKNQPISNVVLNGNAGHQRGSILSQNSPLNRSNGGSLLNGSAAGPARRAPSNITVSSQNGRRQSRANYAFDHLQLNSSSEDN